MSSSSPLDEWLFLLGEWKGASSEPGEFGEKGIVESSHVFSLELDGRFIMGKHESWCGEQPVNKSISLLYYDPDEDRFRRKYAFSYGFVNNEVEYSRTDDALHFEVEMEPFPKYFQGARWRSFINKVSEDEVHLGLEVDRGEGFQRFGVTVLKRT